MNKVKNENPTLFISGELLKQIEKESLQSFLWMLSAINRCLLVNKDMSLLEFKRFINQNCPDRFADFERVMKMKERETVN